VKLFGLLICNDEGQIFVWGDLGRMKSVS